MTMLGQPLTPSGYENMELSTQMILFDAYQMGLNVEILDEEDQFLKLWHDDHIEYIKWQYDIQRQLRGSPCHGQQGCH